MRGMAEDDFDPKLGRIRDARRARAQRHATLVFRQAGKHGARALRQKGHMSPATPKRGMGAGVRAAAGLIAPGSRRVIVKARYTRIVAGDLGAARAHLKYIVRDGVTREGAPGRLYDATGDDADGGAFLRPLGEGPAPVSLRGLRRGGRAAAPTSSRSFATSWPRWSTTSTPSSTGWPSIISIPAIRTPTSSSAAATIKGKDLVMARDYIGHGVRARAQALITLELGPESEVERLQKLFNEVGQERLTRLDRSLLARAKDRHLGGHLRAGARIQSSIRYGSGGSRRWSGSGWPRSVSRAFGRWMPGWRPSCASSASGPTSSK